MMLTCFIRYEIDPFKRAAIRALCADLGRSHSPLRRRFDRLLRAARRLGDHGVRRVQHRKSGARTRPIARGWRPIRRAGRTTSSRKRERFILREDRIFLKRIWLLAMIAVIFEVEPHAEHRDDYFRIAAELRPLLDEIDGFISIERFQSLSDERRILSLSFWRDEAAIAQWRTLEAHRAAQGEGRARIFRDYRLRVAHVVRDYGMSEREEAPAQTRVAAHA